MKKTHKFALIFLGWSISTVACRYIWEYVDPWVGLIASAAVVYCFATLFYKLFK